MIIEIHTYLMFTSLYELYHKHLCKQMPSRTIHRAVMRATMPFDAPGEFCSMAIQDFLVTVCLPKNIKKKLNLNV